MKQMTCAQMGGPATCNFIVTGKTPEDMVKNGMDHITKAHPDMARDIEKMTPDETKKWMDDFRPKFAAAQNI